MQKFIVPIAILASIIILVIAIALVRGSGTTAPEFNPEAVPAVTADDHIIGSISAPITIIEYSDMDCPFCKVFEENMKQLMDEYADTGKVAWVFRHFPLTTIHPNAHRHAEAAECVASVSNRGNFWKFVDAMHVAAPGNQQFNPADYQMLLPSLGVADDRFLKCMADGTFKDRVATQARDAQAAGARGTPFIIFKLADGSMLPASGALSYEQLKEFVEVILSLESAA